MDENQVPIVVELGDERAPVVGEMDEKQMPANEEIDERQVPVAGYSWYTITRAGVIRSNRGRILIASNARYPSVILERADAAETVTVRMRAQVHRLVAQTFIPNPDNKPCINHLDSDPSNFDVRNLEWCTALENQRHAIATGRKGGKPRTARPVFTPIIGELGDGRASVAEEVDEKQPPAVEEVDNRQVPVAGEMDEKQTPAVEEIDERQAPVAGYPWYTITRSGVVRSNRGRILIASNTRYPSVGLDRADTETVATIHARVQVHRLVAQTFIPNPDNKPMVNHLDSDTSNYNVRNLEWCTASENQRHAIAAGRKGGNPRAARLVFKPIVGEVWRLIDHPDIVSIEYIKYQVSNFGRIQKIETQQLLRQSTMQLDTKPWA